MINLANRTEYSFRTAYGKLDAVLSAQSSTVAAGICDLGGTWGHWAWNKECIKREIKPVFGVELACVEDCTERSRQRTGYCRIFAKNNAGLVEVYKLVTIATEHFYYFPRVDFSVINEYIKNDNIFVLLDPNDIVNNYIKNPNYRIASTPSNYSSALKASGKYGFPLAAISDNYYPTVEDFSTYQLCVGKMNSNSKTSPMHIINEWEGEEYWKNTDAVKNSEELALLCDVTFATGKMVTPEKKKTLRAMCLAGGRFRKIDLKKEPYKSRLNRELKLIQEKEFEDYFYVVSDLVKYAKKHMLVGPARGSSCGSLVCYLLDITDIDPLKHNLLFERFIDVNRDDLPDIDIDFPDSLRDMVFQYLKEKYGNDNVVKLGTISQYKAKNTIGDVSKELGIPLWEVDNFKSSIIERSSGDARAAFCIMDSFEELDVGKEILRKYPSLIHCSYIEQHARHSGVHAAGILVTEDEINNYCSIDMRTGAAQMDKKQAEGMELLKIDVLGLRTLSIINECLENVGWDKYDLINYKLDDKKAFKILNDKQFNGIFQFEGFALQSLASQMKIETFEDVAVTTALARPGPLVSGGATDFILRRTGKEPTTYIHPLVKDYTEVTYGVVVYQEQVMQIARNIGKLSWEDTSELRKAMSKSYGKEFFDRYWEKFKVGAAKNGLDNDQAYSLWEKINTMGSWAFNRSHAVAYGMISYWCCVLKSKFPLDFAAACLRHAKDDDQTVKILRELDKEGFKYSAFDKEESKLNWSVSGKVLIGGLIGVKGIGPKISVDIVNRRKEKRALTPRQINLIEGAVTPYDSIYECNDKWGHLFASPTHYNINTPLTTIENMKDDKDRVYLFIGKLTVKNLRDQNELINIEKRGGVVKTGQTLYLNMNFEDDTGLLLVGIGAWKYLQLGKPIIESGKIGDWYLVKGMIRSGFKKLYINRIKKLSGVKLYEK